MELWLIFAIISGVFAGLFSFGLKMVAERGYDTHYAATYSCIISLIYSFLLLPLHAISLDHLDIILLFSALNALLYYIGGIYLRVEALKCIDTTIYFPIYKALGPLFATFLGIMLLGDDLTTYESWGIILGIIVPLLLLTPSEHKRQSNLKKGVLLIVISAILTVVSGSYGNRVYDYENTFYVYIVASFAFQLFFTVVHAWIVRHRSASEAPQIDRVHIPLIFLLLLGSAQFISFYAIVRAFGGSDFSVVFTINAFSVVIPIILSVWLYKEHINLRKVVVIILSILSIVLFGL